MSGNPSKTSGQWHSTKGNVKEGLGAVTGSHNLHSSGQQERAEGHGEYDAARTKGYAEGTQDHVGGKKDSVVGSITGDRSQQAQGDARQSKGSTQRDFNRNI